MYVTISRMVPRKMLAPTPVLVKAQNTFFFPRSMLHWKVKFPPNPVYKYGCINIPWKSKSIYFLWSCNEKDHCFSRTLLLMVDLTSRVFIIWMLQPSTNGHWWFGARFGFLPENERECYPIQIPNHQKIHGKMQGFKPSRFGL